MAPIRAARVGVRRNAVTVTAFVPTSLSGLALWLDAGQITGAADATAVATWQDRSGNARDATQITLAKQPIYRSTGALLTPSGKPVVQFDGVSSQLVSASPSGFPTGNADVTMFVVFETTTTSINTQVAFSYGVAGTRQAPHVGISGSATTALFGAYADDLAFAETNPLNTFHVSSYVYTSADTTVRGLVDGGVNSGSRVLAAAPNWGVGPFYVGGFFGLSGFYVMGAIAEVVVYSRALSTTERQQCEAYLKAKHGTP